MNLSTVVAPVHAEGSFATDINDEVDAPGHCPTAHSTRQDLGEWAVTQVPTAMIRRRHGRGRTMELRTRRSPQHTGFARSQRSRTLRPGPAPTGSVLLFPPTVDSRQQIASGWAP